MPSPSYAFEPPAYVARVRCEGAARVEHRHGEDWHDFEYHALLQEIRKHEGEMVANPPLLFKITVVVGCAMSLGGVVGLGLGLVRLAARLS